MSCFSWSHFLLVQKNLRTSQRDGCSYEKGSLGKDLPSIGMLVGLLLVLTWQAASALLGQEAYHWPADVAYANNQTGLPISLALARTYQGIILGVFRVVGPTPPQVALQGSWKEFLPSMIDVQQYAGLSLVVLGRLARGCTKSANLLPEGSCQNSLAHWYSCRNRILKLTPQLVGVLVEPL